MRDKLARFLQGRYGPDMLSRDLLLVSIIIAFLNLFLRSKVLSYVPMIISMLVIYRMMSKKYSKRYNENRVYALFKQRMRTNTIDRLKFKYFRCKNCKQRVRVPRGRGKITITCPKCHHKFDGKS